MRGRRNLRKVCRAQEIEEETHATQEQETCQHAERPVLYFLALIFDVEFFFPRSEKQKKITGFFRSVQKQKYTCAPDARMARVVLFFWDTGREEKTRDR